MKVKLVEIIRYGATSLGVDIFGIFNWKTDKILKVMTEYNQYRGGKYPSIYITEISMNEEDVNNKRIRYDLKT